MDGFQKDLLRSELKKCATVQEMFDTLTKYLELEKCHLNAIQKTFLIEGLIKGICLVNPDLRSEKIKFG